MSISIRQYFGVDTLEEVEVKYLDFEEALDFAKMAQEEIRVLKAKQAASVGMISYINNEKD